MIASMLGFGSSASMARSIERSDGLSTLYSIAAPVDNHSVFGVQVGNAEVTARHSGEDLAYTVSASKFRVQHGHTSEPAQAWNASVSPNLLARRADRRTRFLHHEEEDERGRRACASASAANNYTTTGNVL